MFDIDVYCTFVLHDTYALECYCCVMFCVFPLYIK